MQIKSLVFSIGEEIKKSWNSFLWLFRNGNEYRGVPLCCPRAENLPLWYVPAARIILEIADQIGEIGTLRFL
jgi:hypothetical protein